MKAFLKRLFGAPASSHKGAVSWEALPQISPDELLQIGIGRQKPWTCTSRGNGHHDVRDAQGTVFAHVHCWDVGDHERLSKALSAVPGEATC